MKFCQNTSELDVDTTELTLWNADSFITRVVFILRDTFFVLVLCCTWRVGSVNVSAESKADRKSLCIVNVIVWRVELAHSCAPTFASEATSTIRTTAYPRRTRPMNGISVMARQINMTFCLLMASLYRSRCQATFAIFFVFLSLSKLSL
jgi:hypothetical protein